MHVQGVSKVSATFAAMRSARRVIVTAARRVNVRSRMRRASAPRTIKCATRCAGVFVLPVPAPAMIRSGPGSSCGSRRYRSRRPRAGSDSAQQGVLKGPPLKTECNQKYRNEWTIGFGGADSGFQVRCSPLTPLLAGPYGMLCRSVCRSYPDPPPGTNGPAVRSTVGAHEEGRGGASISSARAIRSASSS